MIWVDLAVERVHWSPYGIQEGQTRPPFPVTGEAFADPFSDARFAVAFEFPATEDDFFLVNDATPPFFHFANFFFSFLL